MKDWQQETTYQKIKKILNTNQLICYDNKTYKT